MFWAARQGDGLAQTVDLVAARRGRSGIVYCGARASADRLAAALGAAGLSVTVIEAQPNRITQVKTVETDGYRALQVSAGSRKASRVVKPAAGHFAAAKVEAGDLMMEFRLDDADDGDFAAGNELKVDLFEEGQKVDVIGTSIGKGFAGAIKRWNFSMQDATHGNSLAHRAPGSIGQNQTPGRVFKGKKMAGHMGSARVTTQNLQVVKTDADRGVIMVKGAVPGSKGGWVTIKDAVKKAAPADLPMPAAIRSAAGAAPAVRADPV